MQALLLLEDSHLGVRQLPGKVRQPRLKAPHRENNVLLEKSK